MDPTTRTTRPIVVGSSVLGIKYNGGVMLASDTLASYGSLARFKETSRLKKVGTTNIVLGASGDYSDFQMIMRNVEDLIDEDYLEDDSCRYTPKAVHSYLGRVMYNRRNKFDPYYNAVLVGGFQNGEGFLGYVDLVGSQYKDDIAATGFGNYLAVPLLRKARDTNPNMNENEARAVLEQCMAVLFYRDCRTTDKIQIAKIDKNGASISDPFRVQTNWDVASFAHKNYQSQVVAL